MKPINSLFDLAEVTTRERRNPSDHIQGITSRLMERYKSSKHRIGIGGSGEELKKERSAQKA